MEITLCQIKSFRRVRKYNLKMKDPISVYLPPPPRTEQARQLDTTSDLPFDLCSHRNRTSNPNARQQSC